MIRIRTNIEGADKVSTFLFSENHWVTIYHLSYRSYFLDADTFQQAGINHLAACRMVVNHYTGLNNEIS